MSLKITINLTNKWFFSLALTILILILGIGVLAVNGVFHPASEISPGTFQAGNYIFPGNITASNIGGCYIIYGSHSCAPGYQTVLTGRLGGIENYFPHNKGGRPRNGLVCIEDDVPSLNHYNSDSYFNRLLRSNDAGNGMDSINTSCAICCKGGIYTVFGTNTCAPGYQKLYEGRAGGIEQHKAPEKYVLYPSDNIVDIYDTRYGETLCLDITAPYIERWSGSGYSTRLMRYTSNGIGMDRVNSTCAVCGWSGY